MKNNLEDVEAKLGLQRKQISKADKNLIKRKDMARYKLDPNILNARPVEDHVEIKARMEKLDGGFGGSIKQHEELYDETYPYTKPAKKQSEYDIFVIFDQEGRKKLLSITNNMEVKCDEKHAHSAAVNLMKTVVAGIRTVKNNNVDVLQTNLTIALKTLDMCKEKITDGIAKNDIDIIKNNIIKECF